MDGELKPLDKVDLGVAPPVKNVDVSSKLEEAPPPAPIIPQDPKPQFTTQSVDKSLEEPIKPDHKKAMEFLDASKNYFQSPTVENKFEMLKHVTDKTKSDETAHINTQTQWDGVLFSLLNHDYNSAWKAYNGGPTHEEEAYSPIFGKAIKQFNARGWTGKMFVKDENGQLQQIDPKQIDAIEARGGYFISPSDRTATEDKVYQGASENAKKAITGIPASIMEQNVTAQKMAGQMSQLHNNATQLKELVSNKDNGFLDRVAKLTGKEKFDLLRATNAYVGSTTGANAEQGASRGGSATGTQGATANFNAGLDLGLGGAKGVPPVPATGGNPAIPGAAPSPSLGANAGGALGTSSTNQATSSANATAGASVSSGSSAQTQQQLRDTINAYIGGGAETPQQFMDLQRYLALNQTVEDQYAQMVNAGVIPPGASGVTQHLDPLLGGRQSVMIKANEVQKLAALASAYQSFLDFQIQRYRGNLPPTEQLQQEWFNSKRFKGINNYYDTNIENIKAKNGKVNREFKEGDITIDPKTNRPMVYKKDGTKEYVNE